MQAVQHNLGSMFASRQLRITTKNKAKSTEKLSSGYRINRSADDAAGLAISEKMRWQLRGLGRAASNIQDGISFVQTGEGALNEVHSMLQRIRELSVQASNDTNTDQDREAIDQEIQQIKEETQRVFDETMFNGIFIFKAPYLPDISTEPNDYKMFNLGNGTTAGGIAVNSKRYTWDELGVPEKPEVEWNKEFHDTNGELIRLRLEKGADRSQLHRVYQMDANEQGILINDMLAGTWDGSIHQDGDRYSFSFHGMDISFTAESGATRQEIINRLKPDGISGITWDAIPGALANTAAVVSTGDSMRINVTESNKGDIENWRYRVLADEGGVGIRQENYTVSDGITHTKRSWPSFTNQDSGEPSYPIVDWGVTADNPVPDKGVSDNPVTVDNEATYHYEDAVSTKQPDAISFDFSFPLDEVSKAEAIRGLTQLLSGSQVSAPIASVTDSSSNVNVTSFSGISFHFQRDQLLRNFGSDGSSSSMNVTVERTKVDDGTFDAYQNRRSLEKAYARWTTDTVRNVVEAQGTVFVDVDAEGNKTYRAFSRTGEEKVSRTRTEKEYMLQELKGQDLLLEQTGSTSTSEAFLEEVMIPNTETSHGEGEAYTYQAQVRRVVTEDHEESYYKNQGIYSGSGEFQGRADSMPTYAYTEGNYDPKSSSILRDTNSRVYHASSASDGDANRYYTAGWDSSMDKTYELSHYEYAVKNGNGTVIMTGRSEMFVDTGRDAVILDSENDYNSDLAHGISRSGKDLMAENVDNSVYLSGFQNLNSGASSYQSKNYVTDQAVRDVTMRGSDVDGRTASFTMRYDDTADEKGEQNRTETVTFTPNGNASRSFSKSRSASGSASASLLKLRMNPPEKLLHIQSGAIGHQDIPLRWNALTNTIIGISSARVKNYSQAQQSIAAADESIDYITDIRTKFGAYQNRLEHAYAIDRNTEENTQAAESRLRDTDMAKEMLSYSRHDILAQAGQAMLTQANQQPQGIVTLLS